MSKKIRRILFYIFLILFILAGLGVIFYCQGWRIIAENCEAVKLWSCKVKLQKTGAVFVETKPKGVIIQIDDEVFQDKSKFIQSGTLITNLPSKNYEIQIKKEGYLDWQKNFKLEPGLVAEIVGVVLIPGNIEKTPVSSSRPINDFWFYSPQKIVFGDKNSLYFLEENSPFKLRGDEVVSWNEDGDKIILKDSKNKTYYLYETNNLSKSLNISAMFNNLKKGALIEDVKFYPTDPNKLIIKEKSGLSLLDTNRIKLESLLEEPLLAWSVKSPIIYFIKETDCYFVGTFNFVVRAQSFITKLPEEIQGLKISEISSFDNKIAILDKGGNFYLFNRGTQNFQKIAHSAEKFIFSPDNKKVAFLDKDGKINIYFLEDYQKGINKKAGEVIGLNFYLKEKGLGVKNLFWYKDSAHLLIEYSDKDGKRKVDFIEVDDRTPTNKYTLIDGFSKFYYDLKSNRLYFIQENNLYFSEI
jgi:hypothetical protein